MLGLITAIMRPFLYRTALLIVVVVRPSVRPLVCRFVSFGCMYGMYGLSPERNRKLNSVGNIPQSASMYFAAPFSGGEVKVSVLI